MHLKTENLKEQRTRSVANSVVQERSDAKGLGFFDNRKSSIMQMELVELMDQKSNKAIQLTRGRKRDRQKGRDEKLSRYDDDQLNMENPVSENPELSEEDESGNLYGLGDISSKDLHKARKSTKGAQLDVQAKMVEITNLLKSRLIKDEEEEATTTAKYSEEVIGNGLCGGWSKLFIQYPDWVEPIYNAVRTWVRPTKVSDLEALRDFENHLEKKTKFKGAENVVKVLREVYSIMRTLEPKAKYDSLPKWTDLDVENQPSSPVNDESSQTEKITIRLKGKNAAKLVCNKVEALTKNNKPGECMVHIESDIHHMALRVQKKIRKGKGKKIGLEITVVESEKSGIVKVESWKKAEYTLNNWLAIEEPDLVEIDVVITKTGF
jgi:hypothetical protein